MWGLSERLADGSTLRASLESVERQTGQRPAQLNGPPLPDYLIPAWIAFAELSARRTSSGFGVNPLTWTDLHAWMAVRYRGAPPPGWLLDAILHLDDAYMTHQSAAEAKRQRGKKKAPG